MEITNIDILEIDPYKAVDACGSRYTTFKKEETFVKCRRLLKEYLSKCKDRKKALSALKIKHA